jgi:hypothetical protein
VHLMRFKGLPSCAVAVITFRLVSFPRGSDCRCGRFTLTQSSLAKLGHRIFDMEPRVVEGCRGVNCKLDRAFDQAIVRTREVLNVEVSGAVVAGSDSARLTVNN